VPRRTVPSPCSRTRRPSQGRRSGSAGSVRFKLKWGGRRVGTRQGVAGSSSKVLDDRHVLRFVAKISFIRVPTAPVSFLGVAAKLRGADAARTPGTATVAVVTEERQEVPTRRGRRLGRVDGLDHS